MLIIPAVDLRNGQCVRLQQGQFDRVSIYQPTPQELAEKYRQQGAQRLHVVDLDGAKSGTVQQLGLIQSMQRSDVLMQAGGGIRSIASAQACTAAGVNALVIGSIAVSDPELTLQIIAQTGAERVVLAFDVNMEHGLAKPAIHGWQTSTASSLWDLVRFYQHVGITQVLCTDIACDGMMQGPNFKLYEQAVALFPTIAWQASGGIRHLEDIRKLAASGVAAVILGRMLYETEFCLSACIEELAPC